jgi:hypothetical protein
MSKLKIIVLAVVALLVLLVFVPFHMVVARSCVISVLDGSGKPWPDAKVGRGWAYGSPETLEEAHTGSDGLVSFERRIRSHSLIGRAFAVVVNVIAVHGSAHISDEYLVSVPEGFIAEIDGEASFKWFDETGHTAQVDLSGLPRGAQHRIKFTFKKKTP